jgi:hypothetical protein
VLESRQAPETGTLMLELDLNPFVVPGSNAGQRLIVQADGITIGTDRIVGEGTVGYPIPPTAGRGPHRMTIRLGMPDSQRPADLGFNADRRQLGFMIRSATLRHLPATPPVPGRRLPPLALPAVQAGAQQQRALRALTGVQADDLVRGFESLGHNCEFGVAQRHCGAEPLGLLRFAAITLPALLRALEDDFAGCGNADQIEILLAGEKRREFIMRDTRHDLRLHSWRFEDETSEAAIRNDAARHLGYLRRLFLETIGTAEKIALFQRPGQTLLSQALPLLARLRHHGPNALLFVVEGDTHPPGTVEELGYGLFRGWLDRMAPHTDVGKCNLAGWLSICANTRRLWEVQKAALAGGFAS